MKHILLDETDFEKLTKGEVVEKDGVKIALQDIGYDNMYDILNKNISKFYGDTNYEEFKRLLRKGN